MKYEQTNIEGYLLKVGENVVEIYNLCEEPVITYYTRTTSVAVHKLLPIDTIAVLLYFIKTKSYG